MTRTHKSNDVPHNHPDAEPAFQEHQIPKYFGKNGFSDQAPNKIKKNGAGKGNWGNNGGEFEDLNDFVTFKTRRRSNSMSHPEDIASKFEHNDPEPVFEEEMGGEVEPVNTTGSNISASSSAASAKA